MAFCRRGVLAGVALALMLSGPAWAQPEEPPDTGEPPVKPDKPAKPKPPPDETPPDKTPPDKTPPDETPPDSAAPKPDSPPDEAVKPDAAKADKPKAEAEAKVGADEKDKPEQDEPHRGSFAFGSYGRMIAASDHAGRPGRNADIVAYGSRFDHDNYVELELRRDDHWSTIDADTRLVATLALANPIFHYSGDFDVQLAVRNLYLEERHVGLKDLSVWVGSRMLRGDDIYLLDWWPLDNLNTVGGGVRYDAETNTHVQLHFGLGQPSNPFYEQQAKRPAPLNQFGAATVDILDRQRWLASLKLEQQFQISKTGGIKVIGYGEAHGVPSAERETATLDVVEDLPADNGFVLGAQLGGWTGERDTHVNLFIRYANGLAAYGQLAAPDQLGLDGTAAGAYELSIAAATNFEVGPFAAMIAAYIRSFRNASEPLDFGDVDEGMIIARPQLFFADWAGVAVEGSFQMQQRGVLTTFGEDQLTTEPETLIAHVGRVGLMPFIVPGGPGSFSRPMLYLFYMATIRDQAAQALYPQDDVFAIRDVDHLFGLGAEWWFGSTSYGGE